jgi:hypothetical protein
MSDYEIVRSKTNKKVDDGDYQLGDRFHEMYSFWIYVIATGDDSVTTLEGHPSDPLNMKIKRATKEGLRSRLKYSSTLDDCWVLWADTDAKRVNEILSHHISEIKKSGKVELIRELDLNLLMNT